MTKMVWVMFNEKMLIRLQNAGYTYFVLLRESLETKLYPLRNLSQALMIVKEYPNACCLQHDEELAELSKLNVLKPVMVMV